MKKLAELLKTMLILRTEGATDIEILDVTADSRQVKEGSLFLCLEGAHVDGHKFVDSAVKLGQSHRGFQRGEGTGRGHCRLCGRYQKSDGRYGTVFF